MKHITLLIAFMVLILGTIDVSAQEGDTYEELLEQAYQASDMGYFSQAIQIFQQILEDPNLNERQRINASLVLGEVQRGAAETELALSTTKAALADAIAIEDHDLAYYGYNRLAAILFEASEMEKAWDAVKESQAYETKFGFRKMYMSNLTIEGALLKAFGKTDEAISLLETSADESRKAMDWDELITANFQLSNTYASQGNTEKAIELLNECLVIKDSLSEHPRLGAIYLKLMEAHKKAGNLEKALEYAGIYYEFNDQKKFREQKESVVYLSNRINFQKAEHEKELLKVKNQENEKRQAYFISLIVALVVILALLGLRFYSSRITNKRLKEQYEQIAKQKEELDSLITAREKLFSIISHDLKGPTGSIMGGLKMLNENVLSEKEKNTFIATLASESVRLYALLQQLLDWSISLKSGLKAQKVKLNTEDLCHEVVGQINSVATQKEVELQLECEEAFILADGNMMRATLRNLLSNAIKFSNRNGKVTCRVLKSGDKVKVEVIDSGTGINRDNLEKIQNMHFVSTHGTENEVGTGLGIQMIKRYLALHDSELKIESTEGQGSTFSFCVDLA